MSTTRLLVSVCFLLIVLCGLSGLPLPAGGAASAWASGGDDDIDDSIEQQAEDEVTARIEEAVEDGVEDQVSDNVEDDVEGSVESDIEDRVDADVEDQVEADVEDNVESAIEGAVEDKVSEAIEDDVGQEVESDVEDDVEDDVEQKVETDVEDEIEQDVESKVEDDVEDEVEGELEDAVEGDVEDEVEGEVEDEIEGEVEDDVDDDVQGDIENGAEHDVEDGVARDGAQDVIGAEPGHDSRDDAGERGERRVEDRSGRRSGSAGDAAASVKGAPGARWGHGIDAEAADTRAEDDLFSLGLDDEGNDISLGEWLVIASPADIEALEALGYVTRSVESLDGLGRVLAAMEAPASFDIAEAQAAIRRAAPDATADYNHVYRPESSAPPRGARGKAPRELLPAAGGVATAAAIGLIDTAIALEHPALRSARVHAQTFTPGEFPQPVLHGTTVLSILVGDAPDYHGLLPGTEIYAGSVFFRGPEGHEIATTASLVRALDWMTLNGVRVVNMSLAGPRNAILETAIDRAWGSGTVVVAAVGNRGPAAKPLYPAAYRHVVAVTAVGRTRKVYRLANRGPHVDFAAPGVDVLHADAGGGYRSSSGTSIAAPFVAAHIARSCVGTRPLEACLQSLEASATDIGAPGFDPVYGYGMIAPEAGRVAARN